METLKKFYLETIADLLQEKKEREKLFQVRLVFSCLLQKVGDQYQDESRAQYTK